MDDSEKSLRDEATFAGAAKRRPAAEMSLGDERTLGDRLGDQDTVIDDIEIVDLEARYNVEGTLGQGGMGAVLLATDTRLGRKVAIKRILGEAARSKTAIMRFLTEAKAIAALNHPNIVQIYDYGRAKDGPFLIMEYVDGGSLLDRCREGALPLEDAVDLACQLCDGLAKAHDAGIVHRDIKPANVLLNKDGLPKLTDFGLAKAEATDHQMTMTGAVMGTPDFMPPEQRRDASEVDARSDLWSLAATVYQMVTGRSPKIIRFNDIPAALQDVLGKALEDLKESRYQTARELREALEGSLVGPGSVFAHIGTGKCPSCGTKNEAGRRFCRGCAGSLETACLSCGKPMPFQEEICGECGAKQTEFYELRRSQYSSRQAQAESALKNNDFTQAELLTGTLLGISDIRFADFTTWALAFWENISKSREEQMARASQLLTEALQHESAHDYGAGVRALEQVPQSLRDQSFGGAAGTVAATLDRISEKQAESRRLDNIIRKQIAAKTYDSLMPAVVALLALHPDRKDLQNLQVQLSSVITARVNKRDEAIAKAKSLLATNNYEEVAAVLETVPRASEVPELIALRHKANDLALKSREYATLIRESLAAKKYEGLLPQIDAYLRLKPADAEFTQLRKSLILRENKQQRAFTALVDEANKYEQLGEFRKAVENLSQIPDTKRNSELGHRIARLEGISERQAGLLRRLRETHPADYSTVLREGADYLRHLAEMGLQDSAMRDRLSELHAKELGTRRREEAFLAVRNFGAKVGLIAFTVLIGASVFWAVSSFGKPKTTLNGIGMRMVEIPAGDYRVQVPKMRVRGDESMWDVKKILIPQAFLIGATEVTQEQWMTVMDTTPWVGQRNTAPDPRQPVTYVTRSDAEEFCRKLTERERATSFIDGSLEYRLPTGDEWQYAASAKAQTTYHFGDDDNNLAKYEWNDVHNNNSIPDRPHNVALKRPTRWGLYDTFGNVREVCSDSVCGASWTDDIKYCQIVRAIRSEIEPEKTGFRVVLAQAGGPKTTSILRSNR